MDLTWVTSARKYGDHTAQMPTLELVLRIYVVLSSLPVLGLLIVLLVDVISTNQKKRRLEAELREATLAIPRT